MIQQCKNDFKIFRDLDPSTRGWIATAIGKLTSQIGQLDDGTKTVLETHVIGTDVELRQVSNRALRICQTLPCYNYFMLVLLAK